MAHGDLGARDKAGQGNAEGGDADEQVLDLPIDLGGKLAGATHILMIWQ